MRSYQNKVTFIYIILICLFLIVCGLTNQSVLAAEIPEIVRDNLPAVVYIETLDKDGKTLAGGSGFFISSDGILLTNYHILKGGQSFIVKLCNGSFFFVENILGIDKEKDIAVLKVAGRQLYTVKMGDSNLVAVGKRAVAIGNPLGFEGTVSDGLLSGIRLGPKEVKYLQITAPLSPGSSGGPLFNMKGEVIGITTASWKEGQSINFAIPINYAKDMLSGEQRGAFTRSVDYYYALGILARNKNEDDVALNYFKKVLELDDQHVDAYIELGKLAFRRGLYNLQIRVFKKAIEISPDNADAHYYLAGAYEDKGLYDAAIMEYEQVIRIDPKDVEALHNLALLYIIQRKLDSAIKSYEKLRMLNPGLASKVLILIRMVSEK